MKRFVERVLTKKWSCFVCGCLLAALLVCCYEYAAYDLPPSADLPAEAAARLGVQKCEVIDEVHVTGISAFLVDIGDGDENILIAFPCSMLFHRFKSEMQHVFVDKGEFYRVTCEFSQLRLHDLQLRILGPYDHSKASMHYNFTIWGSTEDLVYAAMNAPHMKWIVSGHLLVPYLCLFGICGAILMGIRFQLKKRRI